jgi:hypothetical protein
VLGRTRELAIPTGNLLMALFGSLLDHVLMLLLFGALAFQHSTFNKKTAPEKKKEWLAGLCFLLAFYHAGALLYDLAKDPPPKPEIAATAPPKKMPTAEELKAMFASEGKVVESELPIAISDSPLVTLPKGYHYVLPRGSPARLAAIGPGKVTVILVGFSEYTDLPSVETQFRQELKSRKEIVLGPAHPEQIHGCDSLIVEIGNSAGGQVGHVALTSNGREAYYFMVTCPAESLAATQAERFRIIHSLAAAIR